MACALPEHFIDSEHEVFVTVFARPATASSTLISFSDKQILRRNCFWNVLFADFYLQDMIRSDSVCAVGA
jgi:hypothetical protein